MTMTMPPPAKSFESPRANALSVVTFTEGLVGLPDAKRFEFDASEEIDPLFRMRCLDRPDLSFLVVDPALVLSDYRPGFRRESFEAVGLTTDQTPLVLAVVCISAKLEECTANLLAPLLINPATMQGLQVVLEPGAYAIRHPLATTSSSQGR